MDRFICIHGHFYQPPRENPWLEAIELQDSAYPDHDWNEKITAECYGTNATSRILNEQGQIVRIVNNYAKISFNFGPTLLAWLETKAPDVYSAIVTADIESRTTFSGHGAAIAQPYNHMILPLANIRDKRTQVLWGIRDFEFRFGRRPEGMWLPETAVDMDTLEILAEQNIAFTILAPHQAKRIRPIRKETGTSPQHPEKAQPERDGRWRDVAGSKIDPTMAYLCRLPSGKTIVLFFYDGPISRSVAFERLLNRGETFAQRLMNGFSELRNWPQFVHIATDGESYGHHHRYGDMALAYALHYIESHKLAQITIYGEYLERHPPTYEVEIFENTSWSCGHGIERWRSACGCNSGGHPDWNQAWRTPLRDALNWLRDRLVAGFDTKAAEYLQDPWAARDDYIDIILDRSSENVNSFLNRHAHQTLQEKERQTVLKLLELQRHAMLMYTSCGWFFDELSGIETVQVIQYAGRALQLAQELFGNEMEECFLEHLSHAKSNIPTHGDGRRIYEKFVRPAVVDLKKVGAHYAVSSLFEEYPERAHIYCYTVTRRQSRTFEAGNAKLAVGSAEFTSDITRESDEICYGVIHFGDHNLNCGVRKYQGQESFRSMSEEVSEAFTKADFLNAVRLLDTHFGASTYSLQSLFRDEQRKVLNLILQPTLGEAEDIYHQLYTRYVPTIRFLKDSRVPVPRALYAAAYTVLNASLCRVFEEKDLNIPYAETLLKEADLAGISLDVESLEYALRKNLEWMIERLVKQPYEIVLFEKLQTTLGLLRLLPFEVNLRRVQNLFNIILQTVYPEFRRRAEQRDVSAQIWIERFTKIGDLLSVSTT